MGAVIARAITAGAALGSAYYQPHAPDPRTTSHGAQSLCFGTTLPRACRAPRIAIGPGAPAAKSGRSTKSALPYLGQTHLTPEEYLNPGCRVVLAGFVQPICNAGCALQTSVPIFLPVFKCIHRVFGTTSSSMGVHPTGLAGVCLVTGASPRRNA